MSQQNVERDKGPVMPPIILPVFSCRRGDIYYTFDDVDDDTLNRPIRPGTTHFSIQMRLVEGAQQPLLDLLFGVSDEGPGMTLDELLGEIDDVLEAQDDTRDTRRSH